MLLTALLATLPVSLPPTAPPQEAGMGWTGVLDEDTFARLHELKSSEVPELRGADVEIDGTTAYLSRPDGLEPLGAVIVIHEWWGLNDHIRHWADRLAADGYVALAVDLYGGTVATTRDEALAAMRGVDDAEALATMEAAHAWLTDPEGEVAAERTASLGWCFGGGRSLQLAMHEPDLDAAVVYYGHLVTDVEALKAIEAPMLGIFGTLDTVIPPKSVAAFEDAMADAGNELEVHAYEAKHAFANPSTARYEAKSAAAAWRETRAFLCANLWPEQPEGSLQRRERALEFDVPDGWSESEGSVMRLASFDVGSASDLSVLALPGDGGGLRDNLDRWAGQLGRQPLTDAEFEALPRIPILGRLAPVYAQSGTLTDMRGVERANARLVAAFVQLDDEVLTVKLTGPEAEVEDHGQAFDHFCRSIR